jgi:nucleoid-associated protein YgaU
MNTPIEAADQGLISAHLEIVTPVKSSEKDRVIPFQFNPSEYQLQKGNDFAEIPIPGLESPPLQYVRGQAEKLSMDILVDTSDTLLDVRGEYVDSLRKLLDQDEELHAPPLVRFCWGAEDTGNTKRSDLGRHWVLESLSVSYVLFTPLGVPLRAKLSISLKEYRPVEIQKRESEGNSPDVDKRYRFKRGDTLSSVASVAYRDPSIWREIAIANNIRDPRNVPPGTLLALPKLR